MHIFTLFLSDVMQTFQNFLSSKPYSPNIFALSTPEILNKYVNNDHICMFTDSLMLMNDPMACR